MALASRNLWPFWPWKNKKYSIPRSKVISRKGLSEVKNWVLSKVESHLIEKRWNISIRCQRLHCWLVEERLLVWQRKNGGFLDPKSAPEYHKIATCIIKHNWLLLIKWPIRLRYLIRQQPRGASVGIQKR